MLNKPKLILGTAPEGQLAQLIKVLSTYGSILNNQKLFNDAIKQKIKTHLFSLQSSALFTSNQDQIWSQLGNKEKESLVKLTTNWLCIKILFIQFKNTDQNNQYILLQVITQNSQTSKKKVIPKKYFFFLSFYQIKYCFKHRIFISPFIIIVSCQQQNYIEIFLYFYNHSTKIYPINY